MLLLVIVVCVCVCVYVKEIAWGPFSQISFNVCNFLSLLLFHVVSGPFGIISRQTCDWSCAGESIFLKALMFSYMTSFLLGTSANTSDWFCEQIHNCLS